MTASTAKSAPRFVPTLTEVVAPTGNAAADTNTRLGKKDFSARVLKHLSDDLNSNLDGVIAKLMEEQMRALKLGIQVEVDLAVRRAFEKALIGAVAPDKTT